jgi:hypothetical protein
MKRDFEINIEYDKTQIKNKNVYLVFNLNIYGLEEKPSKEDIKKVLNSKILKNDRQFITLDKFDFKQAIYFFDINKWFEKSISNELINTPDKFEKKLKIGKLPSTILNYVNQSLIIDLVKSAFRNYLEKKSNLKNNILKMVKGIEPAISYFKFDYNSYHGFIIISVKNEFRYNIIPKIIKEETKKIDFDNTVRTLLKLYNRRK